MLFPGFIAVILTAGLILAKRKPRYVNYFLSLLIIGVLFSLGPWWKNLRLPYYYLYQYVPFFQAIRVPSRFGIIAICAIAVLSGVTLSYLFSRMKNKFFRFFAVVYGNSNS